MLAGWAVPMVGHEHGLPMVILLFYTLLPLAASGRKAMKGGLAAPYIQTFPHSDFCPVPPSGDPTHSPEVCRADTESRHSQGRGQHHPWIR